MNIYSEDNDGEKSQFLCCASIAFLRADGILNISQKIVNIHTTHIYTDMNTFSSRPLKDTSKQTVFTRSPCFQRFCMVLLVRPFFVFAAEDTPTGDAPCASTSEDCERAVAASQLVVIPVVDNALSCE